MLSYSVEYWFQLSRSIYSQINSASNNVGKMKTADSWAFLYIWKTFGQHCPSYALGKVEKTRGFPMVLCAWAILESWFTGLFLTNTGFLFLKEQVFVLIFLLLCFPPILRMEPRVGGFHLIRREFEDEVFAFLPPITTESCTASHLTSWRHGVVCIDFALTFPCSQ